MAFLVIVIGLVGRLSADAVQQRSASDECSDLDIVAYSAFNKDWPGTLAVEKVPGEPGVNADTPGAERSPHRTAGHVVHEPDMMKPGPWTTTVEVFGNKARPLHYRLRASDHANGGVRLRWINEQLLWIQLWRGRIVSTDRILDVDTGQFVYEKDAYYNSLILPCSHKGKNPK